MGSDHERFQLSDTGNAEVIAHLHGDRLRFDHRRNKWIVWGGHWWNDDSDGNVIRLAIDAARNRFAAATYIQDTRERGEVAKWAIRSENRGSVEAALKIAQSLRPIAESGDRWDADPMLLGVANGVVDLRTGILRPGKPADLIFLHTTVPFEGNVAAPRWVRFLWEIFSGDAELIDYFHRLVGYSATGSMKEQIAILLYGTGSNGKSTLLSTIAHVMGDYCANTPFVTWQAQRTGQVPTDIAMLPCRRLVTAAETSVNARLNEARIKAVVGGDPITARHLYSSWFTYSPSFKLWLCVNHRPRVADDSLGFWRKMRLLPFERKFERDQDLDLREQLLSEESGILAWIIQGAVEWMRRGLNPAPEKVLAATKDWRVEADLLENFLQEACTQSSTAKARAGELYKAYNNWATKQGLQKDEILSNTAFGTKMSSRFDRDSDANGRFYRGIGLTQ